MQPVFYRSLKMDDDLEYVLLSKRECFAYGVPPATSSAGFKAADWGTCIWKGRCQLCSKAGVLIVKLLEIDGSLFAACPLPNHLPLEASLERTTDSSRYFVLKLENLGRKVLMGFGFEQRNDAFDFNATIQDFRTKPSTSTFTSFENLTLPARISTESPAEVLVQPPPGRHREVAPADFADFGDFQSASKSTNLLD